MLFYGGNEIHEVYRSLTTPTDDLGFADAKKKLADFFESRVNLMSDDNESVADDESIDSFITRLLKKAVRCNFTDATTEIKYQLIFGCRSSQLRRLALQKDDVSLEDLLKKGRAYESSVHHAAVIENKEPRDKEVKRTRKAGRYSNETEFTEKQKQHTLNPDSKTCLTVENRGRTPVAIPDVRPAWGKTCWKCNK